MCCPPASIVQILVLVTTTLIQELVLLCLIKWSVIFIKINSYILKTNENTCYECISIFSLDLQIHLSKWQKHKESLIFSIVKKTD